MFKLASAVVAGLFASILLFGSFYIVSEGHVGVVTHFGEAKSQVGPGLHFKAPIIQGVQKIEVRERKLVEELAAATANQLPIAAMVSVNWTVDSTSAIDLFRRYGSLDQFENRILAPKLRQAAKSALAKFQASELIRNRNAAITAIQQELVELMGSYPVTVNSPQIENVVLPDAYLTAVMDKERSREAAQKEQYELERQNLQAQREVQTANAERDANKARADGQAYAIQVQAEAEANSIKLKGEAEAKAIKAKSEAIRDNPLLVDYERARLWNGQLPSTIMGGDQNVLWNLGK